MDKKLDAILATLETLTAQIKELKETAGKPVVSEEMSNFVDILLARAFIFSPEDKPVIVGRTSISQAIVAVEELLASDPVLDRMGEEIGFGFSRNNIGYRTFRQRLEERASRTVNHGGSIVFVGVDTRKSAMTIEKTLFPNGEYSDD